MSYLIRNQTLPVYDIERGLKGVRHCANEQVVLLEFLVQHQLENFLQILLQLKRLGYLR